MLTWADYLIVSPCIARKFVDDIVLPEAFWPRINPSRPSVFAANWQCAAWLLEIGTHQSHMRDGARPYLASYGLNLEPSKVKFTAHRNRVPATYLPKPQIAMRLADYSNYARKVCSGLTSQCQHPLGVMLSGRDGVKSSSGTQIVRVARMRTCIRRLTVQLRFVDLFLN
ncbi:hypothetical protein AAHC03_013159 [Spirometra sp. Aus1]